MSGYDGTDPASLTQAEFAARDKISAAVEHVKANLPGFENSYVVDVAEQMGVRQTRLLEGEYVVTKDDVTSLRHFADSVARGRDYYTPYRALLPKGVDQLLVAGRHYSATPDAQRISREIPPCMAQGQAAGSRPGSPSRRASPCATWTRSTSSGMRDQGADPRRPVRQRHHRRTPGGPGVTEQTQPLSGVTVIDFTQVYMGPSATQLLGDGAEVIKVERPGVGDLSRSSITDPAGLDNPIFLSINRNKRSLSVDTRSEEGKDVIRRLVRDADVVVSNFRGGVMERIGFGYEAPTPSTRS